MARLPSETWLMQRIGNQVVLFKEGSEEELVNYDVADTDEMTAASLTIAETDRLGEEDKAWAHFWQGYFYGTQVN